MNAIILLVGLLLGLLSITTIIVVMEEGFRSAWKHLKETFLIITVPTIVLGAIVTINALVGH